MIWAALGVGCNLFLLISLVSFDQNDWPNPDVAAGGAPPVANLCGPAGAFLAYYGFYYLGPACYPLLAGFTVWLLLRFMDRAVDQMVLRGIGLLLVGAVISAAAYLIRPGSDSSLTIGHGGVLGISLGHYLLNNTALTGASLILSAGLLVGLLLAADEIVLLLPGLLVQAGSHVRTARKNASVRRGDAVMPLMALRDRLITPRPQRDAAVMAVAELERSAERTEDSLATEENQGMEAKSQEQEEDPSSPEDTAEPEDLDGSREEPSQSHELQVRKPDPRRLESIQAVSSALAQMHGKPAGVLPSPSADAQQQDYSQYKYPPLSLLADPERGYTSLQEKVVRERAEILEQTLKEFNVDAQVVEAETGPVITMFELKLSPGIKVAQISNLANDLARSLGAPSVRVVAPIPGKHTIGIEVPNNQKE